MSRRSFDGTPPAGAGAFFDGPPLPPAFRESDGMQPPPKRPAPNTRQLLIVAALTLVALALTWPGTPRSPGSGLVLGRDRHWGNRLPLLYGSAWKEDQTATNVVDAVLAGFRGVDTACQPQHYREDLVGEALRTLAAEHGIGREAVWLQTKFTPALHQGADVPYDPAAPLSDQVAQSVQVSLKNLQVTSVDALLLHGPLETHERTMEAWRAMERQVELGFVTQLGISNLHDVRRFERIYEEAAVKPRVLQNRFSPQLGPRSASKLPVRVDATSPRPRRSRCGDPIVLPKTQRDLPALLGPLRERPAAEVAGRDGGGPRAPRRPGAGPLQLPAPAGRAAPLRDDVHSLYEGQPRLLGLRAEPRGDARARRDLPAAARGVRRAQTSYLDVARTEVEPPPPNSSC